MERSEPLETLEPAEPFQPFEPVEPIASSPEPVGWWRRPKVWLIVAAVAVLAVEAALVVRSVRSQEEPVRGAEPLIAPIDLPTEGSLVESRVRTDGAVAVTEWVRGRDPLGAVTFAVPALDGGGQPEVTGARLVAEDGTVLSDGLDVGADPQQVRLDDTTRMVRATYVLDGVTTESSSAPGRLLVRAVSLSIGASTVSGPVVVEVAGTAAATQVLSLACANVRSPVRLERPCGSPAGRGWRVRLSGIHSNDAVSAQLDVS